MLLKEILFNRYQEKSFIALIFSAIILTFQGCGVYSFTGASISPEIKTISIQRFPNNAQLVEPTLSEKITVALKDKFMSQTNLTLVDRGGDLRIDGSITGYGTSPVAIQANQTAAKNRLTITVRVNYTNTFDESKDFINTNFSRYQDYPSNQNLADVQTALIDEIVEMLVDDIFNKAVVNW